MNENLKQGERDWIEWRKQGIGSSDAPILMGVSPYKTELQLYEEKISDAEESPTNWAMQRGHDLEPVARAQFELTFDLDMSPSLAVHPKFSFIRASLDGYNADASKILEIKCPGKEDHEQALNGIVPEKYFAQLQHQLLVTGASEAIYYSFDGSRGVSVTVKPDFDYHAELLSRCQEFWKRIETKNPPPPSERDYVEETDFVNLANMSEWKMKQRQIKLLEKDCEELREHILKRLKHSRVKGNGVRIQKVKRPGAIDYAKIPELATVDLEMYRKKTVEFFRFEAEKDLDAN